LSHLLASSEFLHLFRAMFKAWPFCTDTSSHVAFTRMKRYNNQHQHKGSNHSKSIVDEILNLFKVLKGTRNNAIALYLCSHSQRNKVPTYAKRQWGKGGTLPRIKLYPTFLFVLSFCCCCNSSLALLIFTKIALIVSCSAAGNALLIS